MLARLAAALLTLGMLGVAGGCRRADVADLTISGSAVGVEAELLQRQLARYMERHPSVVVRLRPTPDAADQRHLLYVQWLNARAADPDILQLDVIWTAEFAAAGWIAPMDEASGNAGLFFPAALEAQRWRGSLFAWPWFMDVGMLYRRTDLMPRAPRDMDELTRMAREAQASGATPFGLVWQGARYEGLVTVFVEYLAAFGGRILDADGRVTVDSAAAIQALAAMRDAVRSGLVPAAALGWQEEQTRFAFQNGQAAFMRNWPYARPLLADAGRSAVATAFAVGAMPAGAGGTSAATLGGSALAINRFSDRHADALDLVQFLLAPEQMIERARVTGQFPPRRDLYAGDALRDALHADPSEIAHILAAAVSRPSTPVYSELSDILQVALHRALTGLEPPDSALRGAARDMRALLDRVRLAGPDA